MNDNFKPLDGRPRRHGWAPGEYFTKCSQCNCQFIGDKRAWNCADCAYKNYDAEIAAEQELEADLAVLGKAVDDLVRITHKMNAHWWIDPATGEDLRKQPLMVPVKLALIHGEVSEALEADRKDLMDDKLPHRLGIEVELVDVLIRVGDLAGAKGYELGATAVEKSRVNLVRPDHKLENRTKANGKKY